MNRCMEEKNPEKIDLRTVATPALAYLGDCVLELCVRTHLVRKGISSSAHLNEKAMDYVRAQAQAAAMERLHPFLTEEEEAVYRRGRNQGHTTVPKSATPAEYRSATGMECLFGWLYLGGKSDRIDELFKLAYAEIEE